MYIHHRYLSFCNLTVSSSVEDRFSFSLVFFLSFICEWEREKIHLRLQVRDGRGRTNTLVMRMGKQE